MNPTLSTAPKKTAVPQHDQCWDGQHPWKSFTRQVFSLDKWLRCLLPQLKLMEHVRSQRRSPASSLTTVYGLPVSPLRKEDCCRWFLEEDLGLGACLPSGEALCPLHGGAMKLPSLALGSPWAPGSWDAEVGEN